MSLDGFGGALKTVELQWPGWELGLRLPIAAGVTPPVGSRFEELPGWSS
jgi:hypothetical protein